MNSIVDSMRDSQLDYNHLESHLITRKVIGYTPLKGGHRVRSGDVRRVYFQGNSVEIYVKADPSEFRKRAGGYWRPIYEAYKPRR